MAFKSISSLTSGVNFNTDISANFKAVYDRILYDKYKKSEEKKPSQTFAPSSFRCDRLSFFRLRGVEPDTVSIVDKQLEFSAMVGTACHKEIQNNLKQNIGSQWVDVVDYLQCNKISHEYEIKNRGEFETQLEFKYPPIKFSCDGILKIQDKYYLLEIKTSEYQSFSLLTEPKLQHIDQIKCYCSLLEINNALVLYQDRVYGETKCFEIYVQDYEMQQIFDRMDTVLDYVDKNIAPPKLISSDNWCKYCKYNQKCKQWG